MKSVLLDKLKHDRTRFNCGIDPLNNYLKAMANQQAQKDNRTFVLEDEAMPSLIIGFYTLTMASIDLQNLPLKLQKKKHKLSTSGGLIARLVVDIRYKGQGFGEWLLVDAKKITQCK